MPQTQTTFSRFFAWWQQGLLAPFSGLHKLPTIVCVIDGAICDCEGRPLSESEQPALKSSQGVVLLVTPELVMSKRVHEAQKGLPLSSVIAEVLPFESNELISVWGAKQEHIVCALKSDLVVARKIIETQGLHLVGVAFDERATSSESEYLYVFDNAQASSSSLHKAWMLVVFLFFALLSASFGYLSKQEHKRNALLSREVSELKIEIEANEANLSNSFSSQIRIRTADKVMQLLTSLTNDLTESTVIDQLILSDEELLIDASAESATRLQSNFEKSDVFMSTEFVSSISRGNDDGNERFRLKASLERRSNDNDGIEQGRPK